VKLTSPAANALLAELNAGTEAPEVATARRLIHQAQPGAQRRQVTDKLLTETAANGGLFSEVWRVAREAEEGEAQETGPPPAPTARQAERQAIVDAGARPIFHTSSGRYGVDDASVEGLSDGARGVWALALDRGVDELTAFKEAKRFDDEGE
jgi:hypothetical protein